MKNSIAAMLKCEISHKVFEMNSVVNGTMKTLYYRKFIIQVKILLERVEAYAERKRKIKSIAINLWCFIYIGTEWKYLFVCFLLDFPGMEIFRRILKWKTSFKIIFVFLYLKYIIVFKIVLTCQHKMSFSLVYIWARQNFYTPKAFLIYFHFSFNRQNLYFFGILCDRHPFTMPL